MRIGIEAQRVFRAHKHGMDFVALELIRHLAVLDQKNDYFIFTNTGEDDACLDLPVNFRVITEGASYPIWEQKLLPHWCKEYSLDLLHCTSNTAPVNCPVLLPLSLSHPLHAQRKESIVFPISM